MTSAIALIITLLLWPWPWPAPLPHDTLPPHDPPSRPVALLRSEPTFQALGWRARWEWRGAQSTLRKLGVDFEVIDPEELEDWHGRVLVLANVRNLSPTTVEQIQAKPVRVLATYMSSYRAHDNSSWTPNNFALASLLGVDFKSWVGAGPSVDHLQLSSELGGEQVPLGRHLGMLVKPHPGARVLASWGNDEASIVQGPRGIYVGEDLFAPENSDSLQVQRLLADLLNRLEPGLAMRPVEAGASEWPYPPISELARMGQTIRVGLDPLVSDSSQPGGKVSFRARDGLTIDGKKAGTTLSWGGQPMTISGRPYLEMLQRRPNGTYQWRAFRGSLEIGPQGRLVNVLDFEHYLAGVVPSEVPAYFPSEALKTMAVVARTYGLSHLQRHAGFDVCAEVHCQVYRGLASEAETTNLAIGATTGQQLLYQNRAADTTFHAACGGVGVDAWRAWPNSARLPYLSGRLDQPGQTREPLDLSDESSLRAFLDNPPTSFCAQSGRFRWREQFPRAELRERLSRGLQGTLGAEFHGLSQLSSVRVLSRTPQGRVETLEIRSPEHTYRVTGDAIRWLWSGGKIGTGGLQSTLFYLDEQQGEIVLVGGGWGHGVGLCQQGAAGRAEAGQSYAEIIAHYYPGTVLTPLKKAPAPPTPAKSSGGSK
jgi:SpoIID/LytB domain protein